MRHRRVLQRCCWAVVLLGVTAGMSGAALRWQDLEAERVVTEGDWLRLELQVLGLRLSYPAYRISLELDQEGAIGFTFLASSGLAQHLTEEVERGDAERLLRYHAEGMRDQVEQLLQRDFPNLAATFDPNADLYGDFMGPGAEWDDPPRVLARWRSGELSWEQ